jgi:hypothetical protein
MTDEDSAKEAIAIDYDDRIRVTLHSIEFERDDAGKVETMIYIFRLHFHDGVASFPVTMTEIDQESMDENWNRAYSVLYQILASLTEFVRREGDYRPLSFTG